MKKINIKTILRRHPIFFGKGVLDDAPSLIKDNILGYNKMLLVTNETIYDIYKEKINDLCSKIGPEKYIFCLKDGEEYKNLQSAEKLYSRLVELNFHRNDAVIAFGGGVIGDTAGYIASTFHRGIRLIHMPTTIIAQVDSSIGGKVVLNFLGKKNIIGSFYQPHMILTDPLFLKTLEAREIINGMGEIVKYGLVFDKSILSSLSWIAGREDHDIKDIVTHDDFTDIILKCIKIKARVVEKDEFDTGRRNLLNFGHTIGHSLEYLSGLKGISHGEAVAMGMLAAIEISSILGFFPVEETENIRLLFKKLGLPQGIPDIDAGRIIEGLKYDKKFTGRSNKFILLKKINQPFIFKGVKNEIILNSLNNCINK